MVSFPLHPGNSVRLKRIADGSRVFAELSFDEGSTITGLEFPDEDWWFGHYKGASGLFPANYVQLDS